LSDIETSARSHVLPFVQGVAGAETITADGLRHVATWCYLKVISLELGRPEAHQPTHPEWVYTSFKDSRQPPYPNCSLALGIRDIRERNPVFVWFKSQGSFSAGTPALPELHAYRTILLIGHLVISIAGTAEPTKVNADHGEGFEVLWPTIPEGGSFSWPPSHRFSGVVNDELV